MPPINEVIASVTDLLAGLGFKKRAGQVFTLVLGSEVLGWLGLNCASKRRDREVEVNPVVGVRHQQVERWVAGLRKEAFHPYQPPTVSTPLGYLLPDASYRAWVFSAMPKMQAVPAEMARAIADHGLPFMRKSISLLDVRQHLEQGLGHSLEYRYPVVLALLGADDDAVHEIGRALIELGDRQDPAATQYRLFARAFCQALPLDPLNREHE